MLGIYLYVQEKKHHLYDDYYHIERNFRLYDARRIERVLFLYVITHMGCYSKSTMNREMKRYEKT